jgi:PAS domain-containing protein
VFPDNPELPDADGVSNLFQSFCKVAQTGRAHAMGNQRYDIPGKDGQFVERHWRIVNTPIFDDAGRLIYVLHHVIDVTEQVAKARTVPILEI